MPDCTSAAAVVAAAAAAAAGLAHTLAAAAAVAVCILSAEVAAAARMLWGKLPLLLEKPCQAAVQYEEPFAAAAAEEVETCWQ
jgi:hypothetical protein